MTGIERHAIRHAELDFAEAGLSPLQWRMTCDSIRRGDAVGPAAELLESIGRDAMCAIWSVDVELWITESVRWFRLYNAMWCSAIEVMVDHAEGGS